MKKATFLSLVLLFLMFLTCIGKDQMTDSYTKSDIDTCINGDTITAFANNHSKYIFKTKFKVSLVDEVFIKLYGCEPSLYDTIGTETIRSVIADSFLLSRGIPFNNVHKLKLESMDISLDKKIYSLIFKLMSSDDQNKYVYAIHIEDSVKKSSEFKILGDK
jgi:hypothetical protein